MRLSEARRCCYHSYVSCINLQSEETAAKEFMETKKLYGKEGGRVCYHGYQSFKADEVDAATAHDIGVALAQELWGDRFQVVIATHCNTGHYHNHLRTMPKRMMTHGETLKLKGSLTS